MVNYVVVDCHASLASRLRRTGSIDGAADPCHAVWVGRCYNSFLIHVTYCPSLGDGEMDRKFCAGEMSPAPRCVAESPHVVLVGIECCMVSRPAVTTSDQALCSFGPVSAEVIQIPWEEVVGSIAQGGVDISRYVR